MRLRCDPPLLLVVIANACPRLGFQTSCCNVCRVYVRTKQTDCRETTDQATDNGQVPACLTLLGRGECLSSSLIKLSPTAFVAINMAHPVRSYITTPIRDADLRHFRGWIEQYSVLTGADSLDAFTRHCVSNRLLHDMAIPSSPGSSSGDESPDTDVLEMSGNEMFEDDERIVVHPVDEIAMNDMTVSCPSAPKEGKVIIITDFLGPQAQWPLLFF